MEMFPPRISDPEIRAAVRQLQESGGRLSGAELRRVLFNHYGYRCGVARIYRILAAELNKTSASSKIPEPRTELSETEFERLRKRAELAEERHDSHQRLWAGQIDALRLRVAELGPLAEKGRVAQVTEQQLRQQLRAALARIGNLEDQVLRLQSLDREPAEPGN